MSVRTAGGDSGEDRRFVNLANRYGTALTVVGSLLAAAAFGAVEQWLSLQHSEFLAAVGGMTAPWLLLPFLLGAVRPCRKGTALLGLACVWLAICTYSAGAETGGDFTGHLIPGRVVSYLGAFVLSHLPGLLGAAVSGPVYAVLGHRWRISRSWLPALAVTAPVMLEPAVRWLAGQSVLFWAADPPVAWAETLTGLTLTAAAIVISVSSGNMRGWPGRPRRIGPRGLLACLARRATAVVSIAVVEVGVIVFCAPPVIQQVYPAGEGTVGVVVTPDGRTAYVGNYGYTDDDGSLPSLPPILTPVDLATMRTGRPIEVAPSGWSIDYGQLSRDGRTFYAIVDNDDGASWVSMVNLRTGARTRILVPGGADTLVLSPDGRTLYVSDDDNAIVPVAARTGKAGRPILLPPDDAGGDATPDYLAVAPSGGTIYVGLSGQGDAEVMGIDVATGTPLPWIYHAGELGGLLLAPNGRTLYLSVPGGSCDDNLGPGPCSLVAVNAETGGQVGEPLPLSNEPQGMTATPDGRNLFIVAQESVTDVRLAPDGSPTRPVAVPGWGQPNTGFAMSPDGSTLYVSVADGSDPGGLSFVRV